MNNLVKLMLAPFGHVTPFPAVCVAGACFLACVATGCGPEPPAVYTDPSIPIAACPGESFVVSLADDPTNGLMWEAEYDEDIVTLVSEGLEYPEDRDCTLCSWGYYRFEFLAGEEGESTIAFAYRRPGYPADSDEVRTFHLVVAR